MNISMDEVLEKSRAAFLADANSRARRSPWKSDFTPILDALVSWSLGDTRELTVRSPEAQHTVSFSVTKSGNVLWAAYPRDLDGAKVIVLPQGFKGLLPADRDRIMQAFEAAAPAVKIEGTGYLELPMRLLRQKAAMLAFLDVLTIAYELEAR
jgi:hypothetical protein